MIKNYIRSYIYYLPKFKNIKLIGNFIFLYTFKITDFVNNWILSTNHKRIAVMYFLFTIISGFSGLILATIIRIELAYPGQSILVNNAEKYLTIISLHGIIMVFFMIIPLIFGAFGNFLLPTQLGIRDVAFPRLNSFMFWITPSGFIMLLHIIIFDKSYNVSYWLNQTELRYQLRRRLFLNKEQFLKQKDNSWNSSLAFRLVNFNNLSKQNLNNFLKLKHDHTNKFQQIKFIEMRKIEYLSSIINTTLKKLNLKIFEIIKLNNKETYLNIYNIINYQVLIFIYNINQQIKLYDLKFIEIKTKTNLIEKLDNTVEKFYINSNNTIITKLINYKMLYNFLFFKNNNENSIVEYNQNNNFFCNKLKILNDASRNVSIDKNNFVEQLINIFDENHYNVIIYLDYLWHTIRLLIIFEFLQLLTNISKLYYIILFDFELFFYDMLLLTCLFWLNNFNSIYLNYLKFEQLVFNLNLHFILEKNKIKFVNNAFEYKLWYSESYNYNDFFIHDNFKLQYFQLVDFINNKYKLDLYVFYFKNFSYNLYKNYTKQNLILLNFNKNIFNDWREIKFEREVWRSFDYFFVSNKHWNNRKKFYSNFFEPDSLMSKVSSWTANFLIPGWAFITPYSSRIRFSALGKVDIALIVVLLASINSVFSSANYIITYRCLGSPIFKNRRELRTFFVDALLVASRMMLAANPALIIGIILLLSDRHFNTSVFDFSGGGDTILFQHLFWFFGHPEVYIIIIPCFGFMNSILPHFLKKRLSGRLSLQFSMYTIAFMGFAVWGHHMYMVGLANSVRTLYSTMTVMISVPASTKILHWCVTLINSTLVWDVSLLFLFAFMYFFVLGGLSGMFLAHIGFDVIFHDTFFVIGHFHVMLAGAAMCCLFSAFYFYFFAIFGFKYSKFFAYLHFIFYFLGQLITLIPMFWLGYSGMPRRIMDYPSVFSGWHSIISSGHLLTFLSIIFFLIMIIDSFIENKIINIRNYGINRINNRFLLYSYELKKIKNNKLKNINHNKKLKKLELQNYLYIFKNV